MKEKIKKKLKITNRQHIVDIQNALGKGNDCLGGSYYFDFSDTDIEKFLQEIKKEDKGKFNKSVCYYYIYMQSLSFLRKYKLKDEDPPVKYLYYNVWSNIALSIMFSTIEKLVIKKPKPFIEFLKDNFQKIKKPQDIEILGREHKELNSSIVDYIYFFYKKNLSKKDQVSLEKCYCDNCDLKKIIKNILYGDVRSGFIHSASIKSLPKYEIGFTEKENGIFELSQELNTERFIYLSWKAIFKYFNYPKDL